MNRPRVPLDILSEKQAREEIRYRSLAHKGPVSFRELLHVRSTTLPVPESEMIEGHLLDRKYPIVWTEFDQHDPDTITIGHASPNGPIELEERVRYLRPMGGIIHHEHIHKMLLDLQSITPVPNEEFIGGDARAYFGAEMTDALSRQTSSNRPYAFPPNVIALEEDEIYLFSKGELIPRFHQIMVNVHARTNHWPASCPQVYAALASCGFKTTPHIEEILHARENRKEIAPFAKPIRLNSYDTTTDLRGWINKLEPEKLAAFWDRVVPAYFGDLWNLYGHKNGRELMGVPTPDPQGTRLYMAGAFNTEVTDKHRNACLKVLAPCVHPEYAAQMFQRLAMNEANDAAKILLDAHPDAIRQSPHWLNQKPLLTLAKLGNVPLLDYALKNGFPADEVLTNPEDDYSASTLFTLVSVAQNTTDPEEKTLTLACARKMLQHGAKTSEIKCNSEDARPVDQWAQEEHGTLDLKDYIAKLAHRRLHARRPQVTELVLFSIHLEPGQVIDLDFPMDEPPPPSRSRRR